MRFLQVSITGLVLALCACATAPKTASDRDALVTRANATVQEMTGRDPGLSTVLQNAAGYAVFPSIGKGGVGVGAAYGRGVLFERGVPVGFVDLTQGSIGAQLGAQTFSELIVFSTPQAIQRIKGGRFALDANASAVALTTGAAASAVFRNGIAVFVMPRGGLMAELSVGGQQINYQPRG